MAPCTGRPISNGRWSGTERCSSTTPSSGRSAISGCTSQARPTSRRTSGRGTGCGTTNAFGANLLERGGVACRPRRARRGLRGADGGRCCFHSTGSFTTASAPTLRLRLHARDVQAGGEAPLGVLRPADPPRRPVVGKVDATAGREAGVLRVPRGPRDVRFTRAITNAVETELDGLASWLGLTGVERA